MAEVKIDKLKPNSHKYREQTNKDGPSNKKINRVEIKEGDILIKKQTLGRKLKDSFFDGDLSTAVDYGIFDVMVPEVKRMISSMGSNILDVLLFGSASNNRQSRTRNGGNERVSYTSYYKSDVRDNRRNDVVNNNTSNDYRDIVFATRGKAEEVLDSIRDLIDEYGEASIADFYSALEMTVVGEFTDNYYGWKELPTNLRPRMVKDGWVIDFPKPIDLKK